MMVHPGFDPIALTIGPLKVHWYGIMYLCAFVSAWLIALHRAARPQAVISRAQVENLVTYGAFGVILGGRFGYVMFYNFEYWTSDPLWLFRIWEGGMSFHGGLIGVIVAMFIYANRIQVSYISLMDFVAPLVPLGLGFGRLGNFIGQELWGRPTTSSWGMVFPKDPEQLTRHPSQLYQAALEGLVLFALVFWFSRNPRPRGAVAGLFLVGYGIFRFMVEFVREPDAGIGLVMGWMSRGQLLSLPLIALGVTLLILAYWPRVRPETAGPSTARE